MYGYDRYFLLRSAMSVLSQMFWDNRLFRLMIVICNSKAEVTTLQLYIYVIYYCSAFYKIGPGIVER